MSLRKLGLIVIGLLMLGAAWATMTETGQMLTGRWSFTESARIDRGTYFRLKVDVTYKGDPQHFDIVVGCNVLDIGYNDGSSTHEVGLVPTVYGRRMSDGKGLVVRVPDACDGDTTANGRVPANFMPVMVVYDDADTLGFGTAYMVDEAYDSPRSDMKFGKATVEAATRAEFDDFRENGQPNLVTREQYHSAASQNVVEKRGLKKVHPAFGRTCRAYSRSLVPEEFRAILNRYWPASRPKYWMLSDYKSVAVLIEALRHANLARDDGVVLNGIGPWVGEEWPDYGAIHRDGGVPIGPPNQSMVKAPAFYPVASDVSDAKWPSDPDKWLSFVTSLDQVSIINVDVVPAETRGFAYCYRWPSFTPTSQVYKILSGKQGSFTINTLPVESAPTQWKFVPGETENLFEEDKFIYNYQEFYLESTRGDV